MQIQQNKKTTISTSQDGVETTRDPKTYLAILDPETGSQLKNMGLSEGKDKEVKNKIGLSDYKKLLDQADAESQILKLAMKNMLKPKLG